MRVLIVSVVHTPLDARIHHRQIRALQNAGVEVTQVAPWSDTGTTPAGAVGADGPAELARHPSDDPVPGVIGIDVPRAVGRRRLRSLHHARRTIRDLGPGHDLVLLHDPELVLAVVGRRRRLPPVVLDVHEDLAASLQDRPWLPPLLRRFAGRAVHRLERWAENHLAGLLLAETDYRDRFEHDHAVVPNLPWQVREPSATVDPSRVVYLGRLSAGRGARELVAVAERLTERGGPGLELVGPADDDIVPMVQRAHDRGVLRWHGFLPNDEALAVVQGALAGLALLHDLPNYRVSLPTKVAEYLAHGVPAIVTPLPQAAHLVEESGAGVVVPFTDVEAAVEAILDLAEDPERRAAWGTAGRDYIAAGHSWDAAAPEFVAHLRRLAKLPDDGDDTHPRA